jgi:hypothetical protein
MATTIDLRTMARGKGKALTAALEPAVLFTPSSAGLTAYHAAKAILAANTRVGFSNRFQAIRKALKQFSCTMGPLMEDGRETGDIRIHIAQTSTDIIVG